jgi:hypothetical protein
LGGTLTIDAAAFTTTQPEAPITILTASSLMGTKFDDVQAVGSGEIKLVVDYLPGSVQVRQILLGDMNHDGMRDPVEDTRFFAMALTNPVGYYGGCSKCDDFGRGPGDLDFNGRLDFDDIDDFARLMGISQAAVLAAIQAEMQRVPEPPSLALALCAGSLSAIVICQRYKSNCRLDSKKASRISVATSC